LKDKKDLLKMYYQRTPAPDLTIVGAGIVGLATAWKFQQKFPDAKITVLEKEERVAKHQTGSNSGVIHSGIYYKPGSFKAKNCVDGRHQLVEFCHEHGVAVEICGKIIVESEQDQITQPDKLDLIYGRGVANGIEGIRIIDAAEMKEIDPFVAGTRAIHVPPAGIVDFRGMSEKLRQLLEEAGATVEFGQRVERISKNGSGLVVTTQKEDIHTGHLVNCAGLYSDRVAQAAGITTLVQIVPFRGEYYELTPEAEHMVKALIYPLPNPEFPFLGVHFTKMVLGGVECGPNAVFAFKREGYNKLDIDVEEALETLRFNGFWKMASKHWKMGLEEMRRSVSKKAFVKGLQGLIPAVREEDLHVSPAGVRAMALLPTGEILDDFYYEHGERQIHVLNAPSPAATACLSIADEIVRQADGHFAL
jgi:L-2-hydroxyglutarate oxidase